MRANDRDTQVISKCVPYILHSEPLSFHPELLVEVIRDAPIRDVDKRKFPDALKKASFLSAHRFRVGEFGLRHTAANLSRYVVLNAFYLFIILFRSDTLSEEVPAFLGEFRRGIPQATRLKPDRKSIAVRVSKRTILEAYQDQALRELPAWLQYSGNIPLSAHKLLAQSKIVIRKTSSSQE